MRDLLYLVTFVKTTKKIAPESYFRPEAHYCFQIPDLAQARALELSYIYQVSLSVVQLTIETGNWQEKDLEALIPHYEFRPSELISWVHYLAWVEKLCEINSLLKCC